MNLLPVFTPAGLLLPFVRAIRTKADQIKHLPHPAPYRLAIPLLQCGCIQVGDDVGQHLPRTGKIAPGYQDLLHYVAALAIVACGAFGAQSVEAIHDGETSVFVKCQVAILRYYLIAGPVKLHGHLPGIYHLRCKRSATHGHENLHKRRFTAAYRPRQHQALSEGNPLFLRPLLVLDEVSDHPVHQRLIYGVYPVPFSKQLRTLLFNHLLINSSIKEVLHSPWGFRSRPDWGGCAFF